MPSPPPAEGVRTDWKQLPPHIREAIEARLGEAVVEAVTQRGGFSPGLAARLLTSGGRRVFVKAAHPAINADTAATHRREAEVNRSLPAAVPTARVLWTLDEGAAGWIVVAFEDVEGVQPQQPWRPAELARVLATLEGMARALTPPPLPAGSAADTFAGLDFWSRLRALPDLQLDEWTAAHLDDLAKLEAGAAQAVAGDTLLHFDIRADNLLVSESRVHVVDWANARRGAAWLDVVLFAPASPCRAARPARTFSRPPPRPGPQTRTRSPRRWPPSRATSRTARSSHPLPDCRPSASSRQPRARPPSTGCDAVSSSGASGGGQPGGGRP